MDSLVVKKDLTYLKEPRLELNGFLRFLSRLTAYCAYTIITAGVITLLFSGINWALWLGILGALFLADRIIYIRRADRSLLDLSQITKLNIADYLTPKSLSILEKALNKSLVANSDFYLHLGKIFLAEKRITDGLLRMGVEPKEFEQKIDDFLKKTKEEDFQKNNPDKKIAEATRAGLLPKVEELTKEAFVLAVQSKERFIEPRNIFSALGKIPNDRLKQLFNLFSINPDDLADALLFSRFRKGFASLTSLPSSLGGFAAPHYGQRHRIMNRAWTAKPTPILDKYAIDFTDLAREEKVGFLIGHAKEYDRLIDILSRAAKPNALLIGEPGSGKETLTAHLAFEIIKDGVPPALFDKRLVALQIGSLVSGASPDELSARVNKIIGEIIAAGNIILYIPDIHNLVKTSGTNFMSAADIIIPVITGDAFPVIGATYPREFKQIVEINTDFASAFEPIQIEEISEAESVKLLTYESIILEKQYNTIVSFGAIKQAVVLAHKYFRQKLLPASAEDLLREALAGASQKKDSVLEADDVIAIAERKINIPIHRAGKEETKQLLDLEKIIHERLIDQEEAVGAVSGALREYRSGLSRKGGPIAVFLFVGPTGVGKTELSKILARIQFGSETLMIRFDMSEYQDKQSIFRFIGSPDGKMAGNLTESVIQKPYSLILLDEFEKAHPDILNLFLQVFDDGRLTDNLGRTVDFTNTIIIATSNAHSEFIKTHLEAQTPIQTIAEELKKKLTDYFRPELLNRFSDIIVFKPLSLSDIKAVTRIQLGDMAASVEEARGINLIYDDTVVEKVAQLGYDPIFGARPLRHVISDKLRGVLAEKILKGEIAKGAGVKIKVEGDNFNFVLD